MVLHGNFHDWWRESKLEILEIDVQAVNKIVQITGKTDWDAFEKILEHFIENVKFKNS